MLAGKLLGQFGQTVYHLLFVEQLGIRSCLLPRLMRNRPITGQLLTIPRADLRPLLGPIPVGLQLSHSHEVIAAHMLQLVLIHLLGGEEKDVPSGVAVGEGGRVLVSWAGRGGLDELEVVDVLHGRIST